MVSMPCQFFVSSEATHDKMATGFSRGWLVGLVEPTEYLYGKIHDASRRSPPRQARGAADRARGAENLRDEPGKDPVARGGRLRHGPRDLHVCLRLVAGRVCVSPAGSRIARRSGS